MSLFSLDGKNCPLSIFMGVCVKHANFRQNVELSAGTKKTFHNNGVCVLSGCYGQDNTASCYRKSVNKRKALKKKWEPGILRSA